MGRFHAVTVVALILVAVAGSASAECAWVAWAFTNGEWSVLKGFPREKGDECARAVDQANANAAKSGADLGNKKDGVHFVCLPDTVDPRGPKAK